MKFQEEVVQMSFTALKTTLTYMLRAYTFSSVG